MTKYIFVTFSDCTLQYSLLHTADNDQARAMCIVGVEVCSLPATMRCSALSLSCLSSLVSTLLLLTAIVCLLGPGGGEADDVVRLNNQYDVNSDAWL